MKAAENEPFAVPQMDALRIAGRRAAMRAMQDAAIDAGWQLLDKATGDDYDGQGSITVSGTDVRVDIGPWIDAAVTEAVLLLQPEPAHKAKPWWQRVWEASEEYRRWAGR